MISDFVLKNRQNPCNVTKHHSNMQAYCFIYIYIILFDKSIVTSILDVKTCGTFASSILVLRFAQYKTTWLLPCCWNQQSLSRCINCQRYLRSTVTSRKTPTTGNWSEHLSPCYSYAI